MVLDLRPLRLRVVAVQLGTLAIDPELERGRVWALREAATVERTFRVRVLDARQPAIAHLAAAFAKPIRRRLIAPRLSDGNNLNSHGTFSSLPFLNRSCKKQLCALARGRELKRVVFIVAKPLKRFEHLAERHWADVAFKERDQPRFPALLQIEQSRRFFIAVRISPRLTSLVPGLAPIISHRQPPKPLPIGEELDSLLPTRHHQERTQDEICSGPRDRR